MAGARQKNPHYLSEIPYRKRSELCKFLDLREQWRPLAAELGHSFDSVEHFGLALQRLDGSPSRDILDDWSCQNPTFADLINILNKLNYIRAIHILLHDLEPTQCQESVHSPGKQRPGLQDTYIPPPEPPRMASSKAHAQATTCPEKDVHGYQPLGYNAPMKAYQGSPSQQPYSWPQQEHVASRIDYNTKLNSKLSDLSMNKLDMFPSKEYVNVGPSKQLMNIAYMNETARVPVESPDASEQTSDVTLSDAQSNNLTPSPLQSPCHYLQDEKSSIGWLNAISFPYAEIKEGTNNFAEDSILGIGGFGVVYRAVIARSNVAVKLLKKTNEPVKEWQRFERHLKDITSYRHDNILDFMGYCIDGRELCLVYKYMENGSLEDRLQRKGGTEPLSWRQRHSIMRGASRGLQYLHTAKNTPLIHGDIKSANILLDVHLKAKIADFDEARTATGYSETGKYTHVEASTLVQTHVYGTRAYLPADFFSSGCQFSVWTDIYAFGVVLFEVCTGLKAFDPQRNKDDMYLKDTMDDLRKSGDQVIAEKMKDRTALDWPTDMYNRMVDLAHRSTSKLKKNRPTMPAVLSLLEKMEVENRIQQGSESSGYDCMRWPLQESFEFNFRSQESNKPNFQQAMPQPGYIPEHLKHLGKDQFDQGALNQQKERSIQVDPYAMPVPDSVPVTASMDKLGMAMEQVLLSNTKQVQESENKEENLTAEDPRFLVFDPRKMSLPEEDIVIKEPASQVPCEVSEPSHNQEQPTPTQVDRSLFRSPELDALLKKMEQKKTGTWELSLESYSGTDAFANVNEPCEDELYTGVPTNGGGGHAGVTNPPNITVTEPDGTYTGEPQQYQHQMAAQYSYGGGTSTESRDQTCPNPAAESQAMSSFTHDITHSDTRGPVSPVPLVPPGDDALKGSEQEEDDERRHQRVLEFRERKERLKSSEV